MAALAVQLSRRAAGVGVGALVVTGALFGLLTTSFKVADGTHRPWDVALSCASGYLFLAAGAVATLRRPDSRVGLLMTSAGVTGFAEDVQLSADPVVHTVGLLLTAASAAVLAHLMLAFPTGRLQRRVDRVIVTAAYGWSFLVMPLAVPFQRTSVPNRLFLVELPELPDLVGRLGVPIAVATFISLAQRWYATRPLLRFVLTPVVAANALIGVTALGAALSWGAAPYRAFVTAYQVAACLLPLAYLVGILRVRLGRSAVSRLVESLSGPVEPRALRDLVSRTLDDPGLVIAYPRSDGPGLVGIEGDPVRPPRPGGRQVATEVTHGGRAVAVLLHDRGLLEDDHVLGAVTAAAGLALENARLQAELRAQLAEVRRSRARLVSAGQAERQRLERDLHDGVQATLVGALISIRAAEAARRTADPVLARAADAVEQALHDLRRIAHGIRPPVLAEAGLVPALRALLDGAALRASLSAEDLPDLEPAAEEAVYFLVAEALSNALKHAHAARFTVRLGGSPAGVWVQVRDDGRGGAVVTDRGGLQGLQDRVAAVGGSLVVHSPPGAGTALTATFGPARR